MILKNETMYEMYLIFLLTEFFFPQMNEKLCYVKERYMIGQIIDVNFTRIQSNLRSLAIMYVYFSLFLLSPEEYSTDQAQTSRFY